MAWFYDTPYDEGSGRHHLVFVNQQYDLLAGIAWSDGDGDYVLWGADDEAGLRGVLGDGGDVDLDHYLELARTQLPALDRRRRENR